MGEIYAKMLEFWEIFEICIKIKWSIFMWGGDVLSDLIVVVIILQHVHISNQHVVHLKFNPMLYVNYISIKLEKIQKIFHFYGIWLTNLILPGNNVWLTRTLWFWTMNNWATLCSMIFYSCSDIIFFLFNLPIWSDCAPSFKELQACLVLPWLNWSWPKRWDYLFTSVQAELFHPKQELPDEKRPTVALWLRAVSFLYAEQQRTAMEFSHVL